MIDREIGGERPFRTAALVAAIVLSCAALARGEESGSTNQSLAEAANDPTAPLSQLNLRGAVVPPPNDDIGWSNSLQLQGVMPTAASTWIPFGTISRLSVPLETSPSPDETTGIGDSEFFVIGVGPLPGGWGRWGLGPGIILPTANSELLGQGKWQLGICPALIITSVPNWQIGLVAQDFSSIGGDPDRASVHQLIISPTLTRVWASGWFAGLGDFNWTRNWRNGDITLPISLQVGRVVRIGSQALSFSAEFGALAVHPDDQPAPSWIAAAEVSIFFPEFIRQRRLDKPR